MFKLVCFDMDGVIFKERNFWMELHKAYGTFEAGKLLTEKYLHTDYDMLVKTVVEGLWKGKDFETYKEVVDAYEYLNGVKETFDYVKNKGLKTAIISASSIDVVRRVQNEFGVDFVFGNELVFRDGKISGEFNWPVAGGHEEKARIVRDLCKDLRISPLEVIFIGDSKIDVEAFKEVGLSIAFNSDCSALKEVATYVVDSDVLSDIIKYLP